MLELFAPVRELIREEPVRIDNLVFRLHSRLTVLLLTVCAVLVTAKQFFGEPITCITDGSLDSEPVNSYCWIYSTFTVKKHLRGIPGRQVVSPGVGQALDSDEIVHHRYYQWVCLVLLLQAAMFYAPRALWQIWEGGIVHGLSRDLGPRYSLDSWTSEQRIQLLEYFTGSGLCGHNFYAIKFFGCEVLNFMNTIGQICMLDTFLEGQFTRYGVSVASFAAEAKPFQRVDPMARLFPKLTKCTIHTFGAGGSDQIHDALCVLPLNVVNEKIFLFLWFWLVFLACMGMLAVCYRIVVLTQPWSRVLLMRASLRGLPPRTIERLARGLSFGDWFVLRQVAKNASSLMYRRLVLDYADALDKSSGSSTI